MPVSQAFSFGNGAYSLFVILEFGGEAPRPIRYDTWAINPQLLDPSTGTAPVNMKLTGC